MGMFGFMNDFFGYIGTLLGTIIIYADDIKSGDYKKVCLLLISHLVFVLVAIVILYTLKIPEKPEDYPTQILKRVKEDSDAEQF